MFTLRVLRPKGGKTMNIFKWLGIVCIPAIGILGVYTIVTKNCETAGIAGIVIATIFLTSMMLDISIGDSL